MHQDEDVPDESNENFVDECLDMCILYIIV